ncbi:MAG: amidase [Acidobacteria bacterium RIFCSPLOWO2_02_FULL_65_29]|nr:MAG: amidase [Acidobacteria bacterium RIFCSPLOWO2_02_FULL_65_29]
MHSGQLSWQLGAAGLSAAFRAGETTPSAHLALLQERITALNPRLNAIIAFAPDVESRAKDSSRRIKDGRPRSALEGVPVVVKDNILAAGMPCVWGSRVFRDYVPEVDELPVARLRAAGAIILGKTNVPELTFEGITWNPVFGATRNPYDLELTPGGSSGGSVAAVAAGLVPLALGTDGGGSIRRPASHTGLVGLKPSIGAVARVNSLPMMLLDLEVIGPIARTVEDAALLFNVMAGPDERDRRSLFRMTKDPGEPLRVLYVQRFGESPLDPTIAASVDAAACALESLGCRVETGPLPFDLAPLNEFWPAFGAAGVAWVMAMHPGKENLLGPRFQAMLEQGRKVSAAQYLAGIEVFERMRRESESVFERHDLVMTPSAAALPWPAEAPFPEVIDGRKVGPRGHAVYTGWVNACGIPAINLPCAPSRAGLPIGFQLAARFGADAMLLEFAQRYEAANPWRDRWPALALA